MYVYPVLLGSVLDRLAKTPIYTQNGTTLEGPGVQGVYIYINTYAHMYTYTILLLGAFWLKIIQVNRA